MTPRELRAIVPGATRSAYLNAAASSPLPLPVADAIRAHVEETTLRGDTGYPRWLAARDALRAKVARMIGAAPPDVAFLPSTSAGFSVVAAILARRGVREIVTLEGEFPSTAVPFLAAGLELRAVRPRPDGSYRAEDVDAACTPRTGAIAASIVQFASGFRADVPALSAVARARGIALALNGAQAIGHVPVDVSGADFFCAACHKWLMGGHGAAVFFARPKWMDGPPPLAGWLSVDEEVRWQTFGGAHVEQEGGVVVARGARLRREASALESGGGAWTVYAGLAAAVELHEKLGAEAVLAHDLALSRALRDGLRRRGFRPNAPDDAASSSGITVVPAAEPRALVRALLERGVHTTARGVGVRFSTHVYNDESDVERALDALDAAGARPA